MSHLWNQSQARRSIMGAERTHNPSPAAARLLGKGFGTRRVKTAVRQANKRRRSAHRGNPVPAVLAAGLLGGLGKRFKTREAKTAAFKQIVDLLVPSAIAGNMAALTELQRLATPGVSVKERTAYAVLKLGEVRAAQVQETKAAARGARAESAATSARREAQLASIATSGLSALAQRGRSLRRPSQQRRRRRTRRSY